MNQPSQGPFPLPPYTAQITLNSSGNGVAQFGPQRVKEHWQVSSVSVSVATNVKEAQCTVYVGSTMGPNTFFGTTARGSTGDTCGVGNQDIQPGQSVWAVWTGGDANATATMVINGTRTIGPP